MGCFLVFFELDLSYTCSWNIVSFIGISLFVFPFLVLLFVCNLHVIIETWNTCTCSIYYLLLLFFALTFVLTCSCNDHMLHWFWSMLLGFFKNVVLNFPVELKQLIIWVLVLLLPFPDFNFYPLSVHIPMYSYYGWCMLLVFIIYDWLVY